MKTFREYLAESKKVYSFKIKVAGAIPENFETDLKSRLERCSIVTFEKIKSTPIQHKPVDFPMLENAEVTIWNVVLEYPITPPEIARDIKNLGLQEEYFRVRGSGEPSEVDQIIADQDTTGQSLLQDSSYREAENVKHSEYFGSDYNKNFLKELSRASRERAKELGHNNKKADVLKNQPKIKQDKAGQASPVGSKK